MVKPKVEKKDFCDMWIDTIRKMGEKKIEDASKSVDRHDTCKFGAKSSIGGLLTRECTNDHCHSLVSKYQCIGCGYYDKKYPGGRNE
jgi:hypothetical protein